MVRMTFLNCSFSASDLSLSCKPSSSVQNTTKLPMRQLLFLTAASSSFLTKLVKGSLTSRAKIIATGFEPFRQTWHCLDPAPSPVTLSGLNGPGTPSPGCGPDFRASAPQALPTSVTRAAGINLTKSLALEYAADRILVNTVCLGIAKSAQLARRAKDGDLDAHWRELGKRVPIGRLGEPEEFADLVAFLVSERAGYITGSAVNFDGGASAVV